MENSCEQLALDNSWSLTRKNACHIGVQNKEMGEIRDDIKDINFAITRIQDFQALNIWLWGVIVTAVIVLVVKKMWGKNGK